MTTATMGAQSAWWSEAASTKGADISAKPSGQSAQGAITPVIDE